MSADSNCLRLRGAFACFLVILIGTLANAPPAAGALRVMPLGDSITEGFLSPGGYRTKLYNNLAARGLDIDFVGWLDHNNPPQLPDPHHSGYFGYRIDQLHAEVNLRLAATDVDVILLHIGTNDIFQDFQIPTVIDRLDAMVASITAAKPQAHLFLSNLIPMRVEADETQAQTLFNPLVAGVVNKYAQMGRSVHFVEMHDRLIPSDVDYVDSYHPNASGHGKIADTWEAAIVSVVPSPAALSILLTLSPAMLLGRRRRTRS